jgi:peptide/nickel transport system substrate-binding protein
MWLKLQYGTLGIGRLNIIPKRPGAVVRFWVAVFFCLVLSLNFIACGKKEPEKSPGFSYKENILRIDIQMPLGRLHPFGDRTGGYSPILPFLYSYLFVPDASGALGPDIATTWSYDRPNKTWTIQLRQDARFHDQAPVTAADVKHTLEVGLPMVRPFFMETIREIAAPDPFVLKIRLNEDDPTFLSKIWDVEVVSHKHPNPGRDQAPVGSGPFKIIARFGQQKIVLEANPDYHGGQPKIDRIEVYYQPDKEKSWARLLAGDTDIAQELTPKNYEMIRNQAGRFYFDRYTLHFYTILLYNTTHPLFDDSRVRRALAYAIDRQYIVDHILNGYGKVAVGPLGVDNADHDPQLKPLAYDPQKALRLLGEAGWVHAAESGLLQKDGRKFEFSIFVLAESQIEKEVARYIQLSFNEIGIRVHTKALPTQQYVSRFVQKTNYEAVLTEASWSARLPQILRYVWSSRSSQPAAAGGVDFPQVSRIIEKALNVQNASRQKMYLRRFEALLTDLQPGTFLFHKTALNVMSKRFQLSGPFQLTYEGFYRLKDARLSDQ